MDRATYDAQVASRMTEAVLQRRVGELARAHGWRNFHVTWSPGTTPGWPDCVLLHPARQLIKFRELKTVRGRVSPAQQTWLDDLARAGFDAGVWRTTDLVDGSVDRELRTPPRATPTPEQTCPLTARQLEVLRLYADGLSRDQVATRLHLGSNTVRSHLTNISAALGKPPRAAVAHAVRNGWID